jgi:hypothetical protein
MIALLVFLPLLLAVSSAFRPIEIEGSHGVYLGSFNGRKTNWACFDSGCTGGVVTLLVGPDDGVSVHRIHDGIGHPSHRLVVGWHGMGWEAAFW